MSNNFETEQEDLFPNMDNMGYCHDNPPRFTIGEATPASSCPLKLWEEEESDETDSPDDHYEGNAVYGTTPPSGGRMGKVARRGQKKSSKKSPSHTSYRGQMDKAVFGKTRPKSMEWPFPRIQENNEEVKSPRRHTMFEISEDGEPLSNYPFLPLVEVDQKDKKKKKDLVRRKDRKDKEDFMECPLAAEHVPKVNVIAPNLRQLKPSYSYSDNIDTSHSLSSAYLHSPSRENIGLLGHSKVERSHSEAQLSLTISSGQSIHCPPDRKQFYRNFAKALNIIAKRQLQQPLGSSALHVPRQHSEDLNAQNPFGHVNDELWVELRAWLGGRSVEDQEQWDYYRHCEVGRVLDRIIHFRFSPSESRQMSDSLFKGINDYEPILSLPSGINNYRVEPGTNEPLKEVMEEELETPSNSLTAAVTKELDYDNEEEGPKTLTQQGSTDSESSCSSQSEYCLYHFLTEEQQSALNAVKELLDELERIEGLYPSSQKIGDENSKYRELVFKRRRDALVLWYKVTHGLANHLVRLSKWVGVPLNSVLKSCASNVSISPSSSEPSRHASSGSSSSRMDKITSHSGSDLLSNINPEDSLHLSLISHSSSLFQTQSSILSTSSSTSRGTLQRLFSQRYTSSIDDDNASKSYRKFVNRALKKKGLEWLIDQLLDFITPILEQAEVAMVIKTLEENDDESDDEEERQPLLIRILPNSGRTMRRVSSTAPRCWMDEFASMNLPLFSELYLQLIRVPLEVMQECMKLRAELSRDTNPTPYSVGKLVQEFHIALKKAVEVRQFYRHKVHLLIANNPGGTDLIDIDMANYEKSLQDVLQMYFNYVQRLVQVSGTHRNMLEVEWDRAKDICTDISSGEVEAGLRFCYMACQVLEKLEEELKSQVDSCCDHLHETLDDPDEQKQIFIESCREFKSTIQNARKHSMKALGFSKTLLTDLEIAAEFSIRCSHDKLFEVLTSSDHTQVIIPQYQSCLLFVPHAIADNPIEIQKLLGVSFSRQPTKDETGGCAHSRRPSLDLFDNYLLVVKFGSSEPPPIWTGRSINLTPSAKTILSISEMQVEGIKLIVQDSEHLDRNQMSFLRCMGTSVEITNKRTSSHHSVADRIDDLKHVLCRLAHTIMTLVDRINDNLSVEEVSEREDLLQHYQPTMQACYNLGFEYIHDLSRLFGDEYVHQKLGVEMLTFAQQWMVFVDTKCPRGHGKRPRWAVLGLEFILLACSPRMLATINHHHYENLKKQMARCLDHVIGEAPLRRGGEFSAVSPINRPNSWQKSKGRKRPSRIMSQHTSLFNTAVKEEREKDVIDGPSPPMSTGSSGIDSPTLSGELPIATTPPIYSVRAAPSLSLSIDIPAVERVDSYAYYSTPTLGQTPSQESIGLGLREEEEKRAKEIVENCKHLDKRRDKLLREKRIIGQVTQRGGVSVVELDKLTDIKQSNFMWRRGRKLGEGQFGKVYECFNLDKGEVHAVKMISLQEKSHSTIRDILSEIQTFLKIRHPNIVRLHGVEIHKTELFLFMEYCNQGTLWSAAKQGLPEKMIRLYTRDLIRAVYALHEKGIVHRDIKGANIFLSDDSVKLGDFGLSVQLRNLNKTAPQEVKHQRGTIPYMSPEVVLKQDMGRPMDIWAIGCVVVEMFTSKRPWIEYEDNAFAIMYQLGQGNHPPFSVERMNSEMLEFLDFCFEPDPKNRADINKLSDHPFVEILDDEDT